MGSILKKRLVFVTGKGGTGKTTVAASLGIAAARAGKRAIVCEVAQSERLSSALGREGVGYEETELVEGLSAISIDPDRSLREWLTYQLKSNTLGGLLGGSRIFQLLAAAAPGVRELVTIGKIWDLAQLEPKSRKPPYDFVVVDAPSTGHGLAMLAAPRTFQEIARVGPVSRQAGAIDAFITNPKRTGVVVVALPEEMPVTETLEFERRLKDELGIRASAIVANAIYPERFSASEAGRIAALAASDGSPPKAVRAALEAALAEHGRARLQRSQLRRLRRGASAPVATLPFIFDAELGLEEYGQLAGRLEQRL